MDIFDSMRSFGHEQLLLSHDPSCGYYGIIAIHDTTLGPALGGTRFWQYKDTDEAITDALRLRPKGLQPTRSHPAAES